MPSTHLLWSVRQLLVSWREMVKLSPEFLPMVVRTLLPLIQQLQGCSSLLMQPAAAAEAAAHSVSIAGVQVGSSRSSSSSSSSSSGQHQLWCALFAAQHAATVVLSMMDAHSQLDPEVAAEVLRLQIDPAVAELQLQQLTAWADQLHKHHTAQQQQQQQLLQPGAAGASSTSSSTQQQAAKQQHRADLLSIPPFHLDMLQLLPGGQAYLDAAAVEAAGWGLTGDAHAIQLFASAGICCSSIHHYICNHLPRSAAQQQCSRVALVASNAAVRLVLELQLLAFGAVQRQREQPRQQQQQQQQQLQLQQSTPEQRMMDHFALQTCHLLGLQIKAAAATSRSCLPPEVLQQAGLQLLQALAAPLQQWQLSSLRGDSYLQGAAATRALPFLGETLQLLVTAACGAQRQHATFGEPISGSAVFGCHCDGCCVFGSS
jgi:hypothetical protein